MIYENLPSLNVIDQGVICSFSSYSLVHWNLILYLCNKKNLWVPFFCAFSISVCSWVKHHFKSFVHFQNGVFISVYFRALFSLWSQLFYQVCALQMFSPCMRHIFLNFLSFIFQKAFLWQSTMLLTMSKSILFCKIFPSLKLQNTVLPSTYLFLFTSVIYSEIIFLKNDMNQKYPGIYQHSSIYKYIYN